MRPRCACCTLVVQGKCWEKIPFYCRWSLCVLLSEGLSVVKHGNPASNCGYGSSNSKLLLQSEGQGQPQRLKGVLGTGGGTGRPGCPCAGMAFKGAFTPCAAGKGQLVAFHRTLLLSRSWKCSSQHQVLLLTPAPFQAAATLCRQPDSVVAGEENTQRSVISSLSEAASAVPYLFQLSQTWRKQR